MSGSLTIPSGIVATATPIIQYILNHIPQVGVITTKSIGMAERLGYREPILAQYAPGCFVNAVGLTNPGAQSTLEAFSNLSIPEDRFLLTSIFGGSVQEFVKISKILERVSDGFELNLSCPHAEGYGMAMGQDPELVAEIISAIKNSCELPVIAKLTPNTSDIKAIARAAERAGVDGFCAINTVGPGYASAFGNPLLSNTEGGISGKGILPIALKCIREIREISDLPIIGCGGFSSAADVRAGMEAGAQIVGVGSALTGLTTQQTKEYFKLLEQDLLKNEDMAGKKIRYDIDMNFELVTVTENIRVCKDIAILRFDKKINVKPGEFVFLWLPGIGEKPFSALVDDPFTLVIIDVGIFTSACMSLEVGSKAYVRGPYGTPVSPPKRKIMAVAGGTGLAAVYQIARDLGNTEIFSGARSAERLYFTEECKKISTLHIATDDGSVGFHGLVTDLLQERLNELSKEDLENLVFYNCGPEPMVHAAVAIEREYCRDDQIFSAIDYLTKCGVGICGACSAPDGRRICVDGPFLSHNQKHSD